MVDNNGQNIVSDGEYIIINQHFTDASLGRGTTECSIISIDFLVSAQSDVINVVMNSQIKVIYSGSSCPD